MAANITHSHTTENVRAGETGVGLRWVLGASMILVVLSFAIVTGSAIAGS